MKPINLNKLRKSKARAEKKARADQNAMKFGRTKAQRTAEASENETADARLDGHVRDIDPT